MLGTQGALHDVCDPAVYVWPSSAPAAWIGLAQRALGLAGNEVKVREAPRQRWKATAGVEATDVDRRRVGGRNAENQ